MLIGISGHLMAPVCPQRHRLAGFLQETIRSHHTTAPWTPLLKSSRADPVPAVSAGVPLPPWYSATVSHRKSSFDHGRRRPLPSAVRRQPDASCATYATIVSWRSCFSWSCTQGMEQTSQFSRNCCLLASISSKSQNTALSTVVRLTICVH